MEPVHEEDTGQILYELSEALGQRYELLGPVGRGGMGLVFLAKEAALKRLVAIKVLDPRLAASATAHRRFEREARAAAALSHPNVVRIYGVGETPQNGIPYIVMQYVDGAALNTWQRKGDQVKEVDVRRILGQVASALAASHARGFVHRDIKPGNIILEKESGNAFVADFGIAGVLEEDTEAHAPLTSSGVVVGTPAYMSPEQTSREPATEKSDVYSLGVVAYELLTGQLPFPKGNLAAMLAAHMFEPAAPIVKLRPDTSPDVAALVERCLSKNPDRRPNASEVARAMLPSFEAALAWPPPGLHALQGRARQLAWIVFTSGLGALAVALFVAFPPEFVRLDGAWWERFGPGAGSQLGIRSEVAGPTAPWWWQFGTLAGAATLAIGLLWGLTSVFPIRAALAARRALGWRWETLTDVLVDPDGLNGPLTTGTREFAAMDAGTRRTILHARRWIVLAPLAGGAWATVVVALWAVTVVLGVVTPQGVRPLLGQPFTALVAAPVVLGTIVWLVAAVSEWSLRRSVESARAATGTTAVPITHATEADVTKWYEVLPDNVRPAPSRRHTPRGVVWGISIGSALLALLAAAGLALVVTATRVAGRAVERLGPGTAELVAALDRVSSEDPIGAARRLWSAYRPPEESVAPTAATEWLRQLASENAVVPYLVAPSVLARAGSGYLITALVARGAGGVAADTASLYRLVAEHPRTDLMRRLARYPRLDVVNAPLDRPILEYSSIDSLPRLSLERLSDAVSANALAAVHLLSSGDISGAARRFGENAAFAEHFLESPFRLDNSWAAGIMRALALLPLAALEEHRGDTLRAAGLRAAADAINPTAFLWVSNHAGLAADPDALERFRSSASSPALLPVHRFIALSGAWPGYCANPRELLGGVSASRTEAVVATANAMVDVPHAQELAELALRTWREEVAAASRSLPLLGRVAGLPGTGILSRIRYCNTWLSRL